MIDAPAKKYTRTRKIKDPCLRCYLHKDRCICHLIPRLELKTKITLVIHHRELKLNTNTGRLALAALPNSEMRVRGKERTPLDLSDLLDPSYHTLLFYPSPDAVELGPQVLESIERPIQLIVPDGSWRQASKVHYRHPELANVPRVMISTPNNYPFFMRRETTEHGMATLQAVAKALGIIEGNDVRAQLLRVYEAKVEQTLRARGHL